MPPMNESPFQGLSLRDARDEDAGGLIDLIARCFADYPGCLLDVDGEMPELRAIATELEKLGGRFWVVTRGEEIVASVGAVPSPDGEGIELRKLYVAHVVRRRGLGRALCELVEEEGHRRGLSYVDLWSDTRFLDAHRLYRKLGYEDTRRTRELHDISDTVEYYFRKPIER